MQDRVLQAGGQILWNEGERVMGVLATTRSLGDHDLKQFGVSAVPEVRVLGRPRLVVFAHKQMCACTL